MIISMDELRSIKMFSDKSIRLYFHATIMNIYSGNQSSHAQTYIKITTKSNRHRNDDDCSFVSKRACVELGVDHSRKFAQELYKITDQWWRSKSDHRNLGYTEIDTK